MSWNRILTLYILGAAAGGVWKSVDAGFNWEPVFDSEDVASIGALAINQRNPDIVWVGTGESNVRNSVSIGAGVFKSMDAGRTWKNVGLVDSEHVTRIALDPTDPDVAYVAALGKIVGSQQRAGYLQDHRWRQNLGKHSLYR